MKDFPAKAIEHIRARLKEKGWTTLGKVDAALLRQWLGEVWEREKPKKRPAFVPPTAAEVEAYSVEIGYPMNGQAWCDHYEVKGWKISGSTPMKDWRAGVRRWKAMGWRPSERMPGVVEKAAIPEPEGWAEEYPEAAEKGWANLPEVIQRDFVATMQRLEANRRCSEPSGR